jgi:hypothetical protein
MKTLKSWGWIFGMGLLVLASCNRPTYPKKELPQAVQKLFKKELDVDAVSRLVGKTLYVAFKLDGLISSDFEIPKKVIKQIESAMLSIARIGLSTDAAIDYTVIQASDHVFGVQIRVVRKMQDLKDLFYWKISKSDFDERLILDFRRTRPALPKIPVGSTVSTPVLLDTPWPHEDQWQDLTLEEYLGELIASRINMGMRSNPFMHVLLGIEKVKAHIDSYNKILYLTLQTSSSQLFKEKFATPLELIEETVREQVQLVEDKYAEDLKKTQHSGAWIQQIIVEDAQHHLVLEIPWPRDD